MSGKLDQSLDDILKTSRGSGTKGARGRGGRRVGRVGRPTPAAAPIGGVKKSAKPTKGPAKAVPTGPAATGDSKIQVRNLPKDVQEDAIKEYFGKLVGPIKKVEVSYGPNGESRGSATVIFHRSDAAAKALTKCDGLLVDGRPLKVDVILDARLASALPGPKGLSERITAGKVQPKSAVPAKKETAATRGKARGAKKPRNPRPAKKTAEELDSEMADYWETGANGANGGEASTTNGTATNGTADATMDEEIL